MTNKNVYKPRVEKQHYEAGEIVFSKLKGFPWWPAKIVGDSQVPDSIMKIKKKKKAKEAYTIYFYGSLDYAFFNLKSLRVFDHDIVQRDMAAGKFKNKDLVEALEQALDPTFLFDWEEKERLEQLEQINGEDEDDDFQPPYIPTSTTRAKKHVLDADYQVSQDGRGGDLKRRRININTPAISLPLFNKTKSIESATQNTLEYERIFKRIYLARHRLQRLIYHKKPGVIAIRDYPKIDSALKHVEDCQMTKELLKNTKVAKVIRFGCGYVFVGDETHNLQNRCLALIKDWAENLLQCHEHTATTPICGSSGNTENTANNSTARVNGLKRSIGNTSITESAPVNGSDDVVKDATISCTVQTNESDGNTESSTVNTTAPVNQFNTSSIQNTTIATFESIDRPEGNTEDTIITVAATINESADDNEGSTISTLYESNTKAEAVDTAAAAQVNGVNGNAKSTSPSASPPMNESTENTEGIIVSASISTDESIIKVGAVDTTTATQVNGSNEKVESNITTGKSINSDGNNTLPGFDDMGNRIKGDFGISTTPSSLLINSLVHTAPTDLYSNTNNKIENPSLSVASSERDIRRTLVDSSSLLPATIRTDIVVAPSIYSIETPINTSNSNASSLHAFESDDIIEESLNDLTPFIVTVIPSPEQSSSNDSPPASSASNKHDHSTKVKLDNSSTVSQLPIDPYSPKIKDLDKLSPVRLLPTDINSAEGTNLGISTAIPTAKQSISSQDSSNIEPSSQSSHAINASGGLDNGSGIRPMFEDDHNTKDEPTSITTPTIEYNPAMMDSISTVRPTAEQLINFDIIGNRILSSGSNTDHNDKISTNRQEISLEYLAATTDNIPSITYPASNQRTDINAINSSIPSFTHPKLEQLINFSTSSDSASSSRLVGDHDTKNYDIVTSLRIDPASSTNAIRYPVLATPQPAYDHVISALNHNETFFPQREANWSLPIKLAPMTPINRVQPHESNDNSHPGWKTTESFIARKGKQDSRTKEAPTRATETTTPMLSNLLLNDDNNNEPNLCQWNPPNSALLASKKDHPMPAVPYWSNEEDNKQPRHDSQFWEQRQ